jgi:hypothetical protein
MRIELRETKGGNEKDENASGERYRCAEGRKEEKERN